MDTARVVARRIEAALAPGETIRLVVRNAPRELFEEEFSSRAGSAADITITLSESAEGPLWVAEVSRSGKREAVIIEPAGEIAPPVPAPRIATTLLVERDSAILDVAKAGDTLVVLTPSGLDVGGKLLPIGSPQPWPRYLRGHIEIAGDAVRVALPQVACSGTLRPEASLTCSPAGDVPGGAGVELHTACGALALAADENKIALRGGPEAELPGRVMALWPSAGGAVAIVKDLETNRHAAYSVVVACGR